MKLLRHALLIGLATIPAACGGGGGGGGGGGAPPAPPAPPPVTLPAITGPASPLPPGFQSVPIAGATFTGTTTGAAAWSVTAGALPPGITLTPAGVYSGTCNFPGTYAFTVTLTDANGSDSDPYTQVIGASVTEAEPNDAPADATALPEGVPGAGDLPADDVDHWSFSAVADQVIQIEMFALRRDFNTWQANSEMPRLTLLDTDGTSFLAGIDFFAGTTTGWYGGLCDLDIPRFRIPATGTYHVRVDHYFAGVPGGDYSIRITPVGLGVLQLETEGNDSTTDANAITAGVIRAMRDDDNDDYFAFTITEATIVYFEIWAYRNGLFGIGGVPDDDYFDPALEIIDQDEVTVLAANDDVFFWDSAISILLVTPGTYYLRVTESSVLSDGDAEYFLTYNATAVGLTVESENNDDPSLANPISYGSIVSGTVESTVDDFDFFSFPGQAGDIVNLFWFEAGTHERAADITDLLLTNDTEVITLEVDYAGPGSMNCVRAILPTTGTYYVGAFALGVLTDYTFQLVRVEAPGFETEGNDTPATANAIPFTGSIGGVIDVIGDEDVFSFQVLAGEVINFSIFASRGQMVLTTGYGYTSHDSYGSTLAPTCAVVDAAGNVLTAIPYAGIDFSSESMTNGLATMGITFRAPSAGTFYLRVASDSPTGSADHQYVVVVD